MLSARFTHIVDAFGRVTYAGPVQLEHRVCPLIGIGQQVRWRTNRGNVVEPKTKLKVPLAETGVEPDVAYPDVMVSDAAPAIDVMFEIV